MNKCSICGGSLVPFRNDEGSYQECLLCKTRVRSEKHCLQGKSNQSEDCNINNEKYINILSYSIRYKVNQLADLDKKILKDKASPEHYTENLLQLYALTGEYIEKRGLKDSLLTAKSISLSSM